MGVLGLLRGVLVLQLALATAGACWALLPGPPQLRVRWGRALLVACLLVPLLTPWIPFDPPYTPPAQVWAALDRHHAEPVASFGLPGLEKPVATVAAGPPLDAGVAAVLLLSLAGGLGLLRTVAGARALLRPAVTWRRLAGVEIAVSPAVSTPCTLWLGRPILVLDPATFADPEARLLAVRHELQHQRAGDARFAWCSAVIGALCFANPVAAIWRRTLAETEELACDAALLARGVAARPYAEVLLRIATRAATRPLAFPGLVSAPSLFRKTLLTRRIQMLVQPVAPVRASRFVQALGLPVALALVLGVAWAGDRAVSDRRVDTSELRRAAADLAPNTALPITGNAQVRAALERMIGTPGGRAWVQKGRVGYTALGPTFEDALLRAGLPRELAAVPLIESGYANLTGAELDPSVPPRFRGAGYWMFIPETARTYGLVVDDTTDERRDIAKETQAAIDLFTDLYAQYGDWGLALAAYNQGPHKVDEAIAQGKTRDVWKLQDKGLLNDYVAQVVAAALVIDDPTLLE